MLMAAFFVYLPKNGEDTHHQIRAGSTRYGFPLLINFLTIPPTQL